MSRKKLRAAVVGVGYLGQFHAEKLAALKDVELVGVADADPARARHVAAKHGCAAFTDPGALLGAVDLVSVAVPTELHHRVALAFLDAGVHVLVEKPVTKTLEEADALLGAARAKGVLLAVGHLERFNPAFRALKQTFERPLYIECERLSGFKQRGIDVDVVLDLMIHDLDLVRALARSTGTAGACDSARADSTWASTRSAPGRSALWMTMTSATSSRPAFSHCRSSPVSGWRSSTSTSTSPRTAVSP